MSSNAFRKISERMSPRQTFVGAPILFQRYAIPQQLSRVTGELGMGIIDNMDQKIFRYTGKAIIPSQRLDKVFGFAILNIVKPTALSIFRLGRQFLF